MSENENIPSDPDAPISIEIEDVLDLHTFRPKEIPDLIFDYLDACYQKELFEVKLIHGKGSGILKTKVRSILKKHPLVESFHDAALNNGGWGATIVQLKY